MPSSASGISGLALDTLSRAFELMTFQSFASSWSITRLPLTRLLCERGNLLKMVAHATQRLNDFSTTPAIFMILNAHLKVGVGVDKKTSRHQGRLHLRERLDANRQVIASVFRRVVQINDR